MSEIDMAVENYKEWCKKKNKKPTLRSCVDFVMIETGLGNNNGDNEVEIMKLVKTIYDEKFNDLEEAKKICEYFGYRVLKEAEEQEEDDLTPEEKEFLKEFEEEDIKLIKELAEYTGNDVTKAEVTHGTGITGEAVTVTFGDEEYECYDNYEAAEDAAKEDIKSLIDDCGGVMKAGFKWDNLGGREEYLDEDDAESVVKDYLEDVLSDMSNREKRENYGSTDDEEIVENELGSINSFIDYIVNNWGEEALHNLIKNGSISFDEDKLAEECVRLDGPEHNLARYDGDEIALDGWWCYRTN